MKSYFYKWIFRLSFLFVLTCVQFNSFGQDVILKTQADVDAFDPATTVVNGNLQIGEIGNLLSNITDLSNLSNITSVGGLLNVRSTTDLTNVDGLNNITSIGKSLIVGGNERLLNLDGLSNLSSVTESISISSNDKLIDVGLSKITEFRSLSISDNPSLESLDGLTNISSVYRTIRIVNNDLLEDLDGLSSLSNIGIWSLDGITIEGNDNLLNIDGFNNLTSFRGSVVITSNESLSNIDGLSTIGPIEGGISIVGNENLANLAGLSNITSLGTYLNIENNDILVNINGLSNITSVGEYINIKDNKNIIDISGLNSITSLDEYLSIINNDKLVNVDGLNSLGSNISALTIENNDNLISIGGLNNLTENYGNLSIQFNKNLASLNGLASLTSVSRNVQIENNDVLIDVNGLGNLSSIGDDLSVEENVSLTSIDGLSNLATVGEDLTIGNNDNLINIDGLSNLSTVGEDLIIGANNNLINVDGLISLISTGEDLSLPNNNKLANVDGLINLTTIGGNLLIGQNDNLINIDGLKNLMSIGESLSLNNNNKLANVDGLINISTVIEVLNINNNNSLTNLDGLINITSVGEVLFVMDNANLVDCCGIQELIENKSTAIGGPINIENNPSECSSEDEIVESNCGIGLTLSTTAPCVDVENGIIQVYVNDYDTIPFHYVWMRQEDGLTGMGISESDEFVIDMLGAGTYNLTVTNAAPDTIIRNDIVLSQHAGFIFEIIELKTTNSSNGVNNGSISIITAGGTPPYSYTWSGEVSGTESEVADNLYTISSLGYGEYIITVEDASGASKVVEVSLLDEEVQVVECEKPLDIVILNDVSGSVNFIEYMESKQFFVDFLKEANIGSSSDDSRATIIEWSSGNDQEVKIPMTGDINALQSYIDESRAFSGGTYPHQAMSFGRDYLDANARPNVEKVLIISTDGTGGQITSSLVALADELKAKGFHIISIAFDKAYSNNTARDILRRVASVDALAPGAPSYSQLDADLAKNIVNNYLCPIDPGSSATAYFNRDGAIDIIEIDPIGSCPNPGFVDVTIEVSAHRELSIPAGTYVTFYHNNPNQSGATAILTWQIPCAIPVDSTKNYTITLPMDGPSNIFAVLNDDGVQGSPISFPITDIEEITYANNIDSERVCLDGEATIQALKYSTLPIPACDTLVTYTINVCNISEVDAFGVTVEDVPPAGFILSGSVFNDNGCAVAQDTTYDLPADCCFSLTLTYDAAAAEYGYYGDQDVILDGPTNQTYIDFDGSTTTDEDVAIDGTIDCPSSIITFTKSVNVDESCDDGFVEFTFTITNEMNIPLKGMTFQDVLPDPCTWAYLPYGENGLSIANPSVNGEVAIFTIDEVQANTVATFSMDASLNFWDSDGTLSNTATLDNVPDVSNGGFKSLTSNTTSTEVVATPRITLPDTIEVNIGIDTVSLEAILSTHAAVLWTTEGDGAFTDIVNENTSYVFGTQDIIDREVTLFVSAISECNETGASVLVQISADCSEGESLELELTAENLTCENDQVEIFVNIDIDLDSIFWSGPSNEGLNGNNLIVSLPGEYTLIGHLDNCSDTTSIFVEETPTVAMESYSICNGESIIINNEVYESAGNYIQIIPSATDCDTILKIELALLEDSMAEETFFIQAGEVLEINGVQYDAVGQYMQELMASNGCDSTLILNILEGGALISFDFDDCLAYVQTMSNADYSEFTPFYHNELDCGSVTSSNIYREDPSENMHSCTEGLNDSNSICVSSETSCEFDENSTKMVKMDLAINPNPNSKFVLTGIEFFQQGPEMFAWINGDDGENNYPTKFGLRILKDGVEIYSNEDNPTALNWQKEEFNFLNDDNFVFTESATLEIQLLPYCPIGANSPVTAWDLEDLKIFGSCSAGEGNSKIIAGTVLPCANEVLDDVQILIANESETKKLLVDEFGDYSNLGNIVNSHIDITAHKDDDHLKGVSTLDLLVIQRHLLGLDNFENQLQYIAADVNYDGKVSVADLRDLRKLILGIYSEFPSNLSYRFLNWKEVQKENADAWGIPENIEIQNLSDHILDADFVPVKIGDVTNQNTGYSYTSDAISSENEKTESLYIEKQQSSKDSPSSFIFYLGQAMSINGLHFSINLNGLGFAGVETHLNNFNEDNFNLTDDGILHISWTDARHNDIVSSHLFTLHFEENDLGGLMNEVLVSEVYSEDKVYKLEPISGISPNDVESISNLIVYPNPVSAETIISFDQRKASEVTLSVQNVEGRMVYNGDLDVAKGSNIIQIPQVVLQQNAGVFIIRLTDQYTSVIERIVVAN